MSDKKQDEPLSPSGAAWREWFERAGLGASVEVINATANLVIVERDIFVQPFVVAFRQAAENEALLLRAIETACHAWNQTPSEQRTESIQDAMNILSDAHQKVMRSPKRQIA